MGVRGAGLDVSLAVTLRGAVENREMRYVWRNWVGWEAYDEEGLGRSPLLPPVGVGMGVGLSPTGVDEGSLLGGADEGSLLGGADEGSLLGGADEGSLPREVDEGSLLGEVDVGLLSKGVEEGVSTGVEVGDLLIRLLVLLPEF